MKLISAQIKNFRILKDVFLNFSVDEDKPLTVIQAANETGKTTCLNALIWGLYGSKFLPNKGNYSLFPSDIDRDRRVQVSVEIEFEMDRVSDYGYSRQTVNRVRYSLVRTCYETAPQNEQVYRENELILLWQNNREGTVEVPEHEVKNLIENALPSELKDVYFTDGDSAMSFIEAAASQTVKRKRVANSIESLLGLNVLDRTNNHLNNVIRRISQDIDRTDYREEFERINDRILSYKEDIEENTEKALSARKELDTLNEEIKKNKILIEEIVKQGDSSELISKQKKITYDIDRYKERKKNDSKTLASIVSNERVSTMLLADKVDMATKILSDLDNKKELPVVNVPILKQLLTRKECFCGESLDEQNPEGSVRRERIAEILGASLESDRVQKVATSLYYRLKGLGDTEAREEWVASYSSAASNFIAADTSLRNLYDDLEKLDQKLSEIDDSQLQKIRETLSILESNARKHLRDEASGDSAVAAYEERLKEALEDRDKIQNKLGKKDLSGLYLDITTVAQRVFSTIVERLKKEELKKVSNEMNRIFLAMIGSEMVSEELPKRIQRAELTEEYDIMVYGPNDYVLNPDTDLNGASRRAITLAFILALTKVSKVEAPNIIDTPLGMMSGYVKQSVLLRTIEEGSQIILFLTQDEIKGVESIIDKYAGRFFTLTNPSHYPTMLVNKPETDDIGIVRCECYYDKNCNVCERKNVEIL